MAVWSNRLIIIISAIGIAIAGVLSYAAKTHLVPPCGKTLNCQIVQNSEFSRLGGVPVAYIGLAGYMLLFSLAIARSTTLGSTFRSLSTAGLVGSGIGLAFSTYLTYVSVEKLNLTCIWCISSLVTIFLLTLLHGALMQGDDPEKIDMAPAAIVGGGSLLASAFAIVLIAMKFEEGFDPNTATVKEVESVLVKDILPDASKISGNIDAKVTLIEFADFNCSSCRVNYATTKEILDKYNGRVQLAFCHFFPIEPKPGHETSRHAAMIAEIAAKQGKFWKYVSTVMQENNSERIKTLDGLIAVAAEAGLSKAEILNVLNPREPESKAQNDAILVSIARDIDNATRLRINTTPTYILAVAGIKAKAISIRNLEAELEAPEVKSILEGN